jgi:hypothetical protein
MNYPTYKGEKCSYQKNAKKSTYSCPRQILLDAVLQGPLKIGHGPGKGILGEGAEILQNREHLVIGLLILNNIFY